MTHELSTKSYSPRQVSIRYSRPLIESMKYVASSLEAKLYIDDFFDLSDIDYKEHAWVIFLTSGNRVLGSCLLSIGHSHGTFICAKEIVQCAILSHARSVILCHNHPSGCLKASESDIRTTKRVREVLKLVGIDLLDHIIISSEGYLSFSDENIDV